jgi:hypothetical protein
VATPLSVSFATGRFSWGYYAVIALGVGLVASTVAFVFLLRPKVHSYEVLEPLLG